MEPFEFNTAYVSEANAVVRQGRYQDGSTALQVLSQYGEPLTTATVCLVDYQLKPEEGNVFIYGDYAEHVGVQKALEKAGIVSQPVRTVPYGPYDASAFECTLLRDDLPKL